MNNEYIGEGPFMTRALNGNLFVRFPAKIHEEIAKEASDKGTSISGILMQALIIRRALRQIDPWKSIAEVQWANLSRLLKN
jgi:hypothetical protein